MLVVGIDPGSRYTGYGIVEKEGSQLTHITSGRINATRAKTFAQRLEIIYTGLDTILQQWKPEHGALESIFTAKNAMSSLKLGHARGVSMLALAHADIALQEYTPATVKQAVTGHGRATKDQVQFMIRRILNIQTELHEDASDALAVAICHCHLVDFQQKLR